MLHLLAVEPIDSIVSVETIFLIGDEINSFPVSVLVGFDPEPPHASLE